MITVPIWLLALLGLAAVAGAASIAGALARAQRTVDRILAAELAPPPMCQMHDQEQADRAERGQTTEGA
ncbi:MAG: hypothetical protein ACREME_04330 [Gemmatimonadales bacterium]